MILINSQETDTLQVTDRGLSYGDGVFRTMTARAGQLRHFERHWRRFESDCARLGMSLPDRAGFAADIARLLAAQPDAVIKMMQTRGVGARGYAVPADITPTRIVLAAPLPVWSDDRLEEGVQVRVCELRLAHQPRLAGIKHLNRLENVLARMEWSDPEIAEGLLLDAAGRIIEGTMSNVFARFGTTLLTPELYGCGVAGVAREILLEKAGRIGLAARVGHLLSDDLALADEVILTNSVIGVWQIRSLDQQRWQKGIYTPRLRGLLEEEEEQGQPA